MKDEIFLKSENIKFINKTQKKF